MIKTDFLIYTRSYPHFPQTEYRNCSAKKIENKNERFVEYDRIVKTSMFKMKKCDK